MPNLYESISDNMKESKLNEIGVDGKGYRGMSAGDFFDEMFEKICSNIWTFQSSWW